MTDIPLLRAPVHLSLPFYVCSIYVLSLSTLSAHLFSLCPCLHSESVYTLSAAVSTLSLYAFPLSYYLHCIY